MPDQLVRRYEPKGACRTLFMRKDPEIALSGPAGTGKSMACLMRLHLACLQYPGIRCLIVRKTAVSLGSTTLVTFKNRVAQEALEVGAVSWFGGSPREAASYRYANGSVIVIGGLDKPQKVMSSEYDLVFCVAGDTQVDSPSPIQKGYKRPYSGPLVTIRTASGNELTGTPNHPVLTDRGWVPLGQLNVGGYVVSRRAGQQEGAGADPDVQHTPPAIADVVGALALTNPGGSQRVEAVPMDFHGDGGYGYIDVVAPAFPFEGASQPALDKHLLEFQGQGRHLQDALAMSDRSAYELVLVGDPASVAGSVRAPELAHALSVLFGPRPVQGGYPTRLLEASSSIGISDVGQGGRLSVGARLDSPLGHLSPQPVRSDAERLGDSHETPPSSEVTLDCIIELVRREAPRGWHAYNLQTQHGYYYANNILTHNCDEATELDEGDWEALGTRLRNNVLPWQQQIAACNPDKPTHWMKQRSLNGALAMLESRHEDNPSLYAPDGKLTLRGAEYLHRLDALTGVRYQRLRLGRWVAAEGIIYEGFDEAAHIVQPFWPSIRKPYTDWTHWWSVDFGYTNPMCIQMWAEDPDGRLYLWRELYHTKMLVEDMAKEALKRVTNGGKWWVPKPRAIICDHDAEGRATLERHLGMSTIPAKKDVSDGIEAVQARLRVAKDGKPRLFIVRDCVVKRDEELMDAKKPVCTAEEFGGYVWAIKPGGNLKEEPLKENDHGLDALRYICMERDRGGRPRIRWFG
jgi:hypothetical protein